jgi:hypothetical protein
MINRKALWISILLVFAMIAANIWRLSLLPDWHHVPLEGPGSHLVPVFWTFLPPLMALFAIAFFFAVNWKFGPEQASPKEAVQSWRRHQGLALVFGVGILALAQAFNIARSLGALQSVDRLTLGHVMMVATGIFLMIFGNSLPKIPWLTERFRPLDPWQWNQHRRFQGKLMFVLGLFIAAGMPLLPFKMVLPVMIGVTLTTVVVSLWHRAKVRREPSPQP